jgi:hypothetical protein
LYVCSLWAIIINVGGFHQDNLIPEREQLMEAKGRFNIWTSGCQMNEHEEGKWYIPRPEKQSDIEKLREKALLKEFCLYLESGGKLRQFRSEAIRAGFKDAWGRRDYRTIVDTARRLPESFIQDDFGLLMYYRNALSQLEE